MSGDGVKFQQWTSPRGVRWIEYGEKELLHKGVKSSFQETGALWEKRDNSFLPYSLIISSCWSLRNSFQSSCHLISYYLTQLTKSPWNIVFRGCDILLIILSLTFLCLRSVHPLHPSHSWILKFLKKKKKDFFSGYLCLCIFSCRWSHLPLDSNAIPVLTAPDFHLEFQAARSTSALGFSHKHLKLNMVKAELKPSFLNLFLIH